MAVLNVIVLFKFVIGPAIWSAVPSDGLVTNYNASESGRNEAFWVLCAELVTAFLVVQLFAKRIYSRTTSRSYDGAHSSSNGFLAAVALMGVGAFVGYPALASRYNFFVLSSLHDSDLSGLPVGGALLIATDLMFVVVPVLLISRFRRSYEKNNSIYWVLLSLLATLPAMLIFRGTSRLSVLVPTVAWLVVLVHLYPKYRRQLVAIVLAIMLSVFVVISLFKQFGYSLTEESEASPDFSISVVAHTMNVYFSGPENIATGLDMIKANPGNLSSASLLHDLTRNTAGLNAFSDPSKTTTAQYNRLIYDTQDKTDQIVPLSIQSQVYFGPLGTTLLLAIAIYWMMRCDRRAQLETRLGYKYGLAYVTFFLSMGMMTSLGSIVSPLTNVFLPLVVVLKLNETFSARRGESHKSLSRRSW